MSCTSHPLPFGDVGSGLLVVFFATAAAPKVCCHLISMGGLELLTCAGGNEIGRGWELWH